MAQIREVTLAASAARTATASFDPITIASDASLALAREVSDIEMLEVVIVATALALTPSVVPSIEVYNPLSATWVAVLTGAAITTAAPTTVTLRVGPEVAAAANVAAQALLGQRWRVTMTHADTDSITYSILARAKVC